MLFFSCALFEEKNEKKGRALARVHDKYLYLSDIQGIRKDQSKEDSIRFLKKYVENWIRQNLILEKAETYVPESEMDIKRQLEEYKNSLLIYAYEQELVNQNVDTSVSMDEIRKYYMENRENFELPSNIIQFNYLKLDKNSPDLKKARKWMRSEEKGDFEKLVNYGYQNALSHNLGDTTWHDVQHLLNMVPGLDYTPEELIKKDFFIEHQQGDIIYLIKIKNFMLQSAVSPLSTVRDEIAQIILHKRKFKLLEETYDKLYKEAFKKNDFEVYF